MGRNLRSIKMSIINCQSSLGWSMIILSNVYYMINNYQVYTCWHITLETRAFHMHISCHRRSLVPSWIICYMNCVSLFFLFTSGKILKHFHSCPIPSTPLNFFHGLSGRCRCSPTFNMFQPFQSTFIFQMGSLQQQTFDFVQNKRSGSRWSFLSHLGRWVGP